MKKNIFILILSVLILPAFAFEDVPIFPQDSGVSVEYIENQNSLIKTEGMKKSSQVERAKDNLYKNENQKLKLDNKQIIYQRALDYTTRQNNSMPLPRF